MFGSSAVIVAKHDGTLIRLGTRRDNRRVPCDGLFGAGLPDCSLAGRLDGGGVDDLIASSAGVGGDSDRQCGRRRGEDESSEESGEELHRGESERGNKDKYGVVERKMRM